MITPPRLLHMELLLPFEPGLPVIELLRFPKSLFTMALLWLDNYKAVHTDDTWRIVHAYPDGRAIESGFVGRSAREVWLHMPSMFDHNDLVMQLFFDLGMRDLRISPFLAEPHRPARWSISGVRNGVRYDFDTQYACSVKIGIAACILLAHGLLRFDDYEKYQAEQDDRLAHCDQNVLRNLLT